MRDKAKGALHVIVDNVLEHCPHKTAVSTLDELASIGGVAVRPASSDGDAHAHLDAVLDRLRRARRPATSRAGTEPSPRAASRGQLSRYLEPLRLNLAKVSTGCLQKAGAPRRLASAQVTLTLIRNDKRYLQSNLSNKRVEEKDDAPALASRVPCLPPVLAGLL